jgi:hypothetical protein
MSRQALRFRDSTARRLVVMAGLLLVVLALGACDDPDPKACVTACPDTPLDEASCEIALAMDANCQGYVEAAEVAIGQCLEPNEIHPDEVLVSCARVPLGESFTWTVRSETWQWGPWKDLCAIGGSRMEYQLGCQ